MTKLTNDKSTGLKKVPPNTFKALNDDKLTHLIDFFNKYWMEETDIDKWHEVQIVPVPKSGVLYDPNKWRGVTLVYIRANIFSSILCRLAFKTIKTHGVR